VGTGADAISHVQADHYGLVFLDVRLPDANGFDVLREIRRISPETRVIIISADGTEGNRLKALAEGAMGLLEKPFNITDVNEVIRRAYTRKSR
jgi:DNA-binding response OmpR family regulator